MAGNPYFPGQEPRLTAKLDGFLDSLSLDLQQNSALSTSVAALLLAGGYGRGEGGIFVRDKNAAPELYNDLEFYLIAQAHAPLDPLRAWCTQQAHRGDAMLGIEVEFKILRTSQLQSGSPTMFYYDLLSSHRLVFGCSQFLTALPSALRDASLLPPEEATRLLFNRGSGLFYSCVALAENSALVTNGFIERNHAKVRLALADAVLTLNGCYHFSCLERQLRLNNPLPCVPPDWRLLLDWHQQGVEFKLHPRHLHPSKTELHKSQEGLRAVWMRTFLWLESIRLKTTFHTPEEYAFYKGRLYPESPVWKNLALAIRDKIKRGAMLPGILDYPRASLQRSLILLLQPEPDPAAANQFLTNLISPDLAQVRDSYRMWWNHYN